jgi:prepilin-type N-terminal cleavage/methylation domain-containing protein
MKTREQREWTPTRPGFAGIRSSKSLIVNSLILSICPAEIFRPFCDAPTHNHPMNKRTSAFTLIELLVVIAIIAILMGILFPIIGTVKNTANKAVARNDMTGIVTAAKGYCTDYGYYPMVASQLASASTQDARYGDGGVANENLFNILRNINTGENANYLLNPKQTVYLEGKDAKGSDPNWKGGFVPSGSKMGKFLDPWGTEYAVFLDANNDNTLTNIGAVYSDFTGGSEPRLGVGAASLGKDGKWGKDGGNAFKDSDDVISWQ